MSKPEERPGNYFTAADAIAILAEVDRFAVRCREAVEAGRYVEAGGWIKLLQEAVEDQDVFYELAAIEAVEL